MKFDYIVVQAGGKGTRMGKQTRNKPKALLPVNNLPMIFHLFRKYPDKKFLVIGDYKYDTFERYMNAFADVDYHMINANGKKGTCGGLNQALALIPEGEAFLYIWSDIILDKQLSMEELPVDNYIGLTFRMPCRWKYADGVFVEESSDSHGIAGVFLFKDKSVLADAPDEGEFVRYLSGKGIEFKSFDIQQSDEFGLIEKYNRLKKEKCRPFNKITEFEDYIIKEGIDEQGLQLAVREQDWYKKVDEFGFQNIPKVYGINPLKLEKISGKNIYEYTDLASEQKEAVLDKLVGCLKQLHSYGSIPANESSIYEAYVGKTFSRLEKIRDLIPFADREMIVVNGVKCKNVYFYREQIEEMFRNYNSGEFQFIHGDCTFSNLMLKNDSVPVLIDPRGYFGYEKYYGDVAYDWAKLYYSIVGNYDQFNLKRFELTINEEDVELQIDSNGWEDMEEYFLSLISDETDAEMVKLIHGIIWLSLTTYAWEDYDSICGAFYNGLLYLNELL